MVAVPRWLQGRHLATVTITPQSVAADGTLTDGTARAVVARVTRVELVSDPNMENISPVTSTLANNVQTEENNSIEIEILLGSDAASALGVNPLAAMAASSDILKCVFTRGVGVGDTTWTFYGARGRFREGVDSKGRNTTSLMLHQVDINATNPVYSS